MGEGERELMAEGGGIVLTSFVISNIVNCEEAIFVALFVSTPPEGWQQWGGGPRITKCGCN